MLQTPWIVSLEHVPILIGLHGTEALQYSYSTGLDRRLHGDFIAEEFHIARGVHTRIVEIDSTIPVDWYQAIENPIT